MKLMPLVAGLLGLLLLASPALAHHKPGHSGGPPGSRGGSRSDSDSSGPPSGPGNSGAAHWCKWHFNDPDADQQFANHGQCVAWYAHQRNAERQGQRFDDVDDDNGTADDDRENHGELTVSDIRVRNDGTFRVRGFGGEGLVFASIGGSANLVVGFGQADAASDGTWTIEGRWGCQSDDHTYSARIRVQDFDESAGKNASFPCDDLQPST